MATGMKIKSIDIEGRKNPLGIDQARPMFHYVAEAQAKGAEISSYQVIVSLTSVKTDKPAKNVVWDSGKTAYQGNNYVRYEGDELSPKTRYQLTVFLWDENDQRTEAGDAWFETGFLGTSWEANWIEPKQEDAELETVVPFLDLIIPNPNFWGGEVRLKECKNIRKDFRIECYGIFHIDGFGL